MSNIPGLFQQSVTSYPSGANSPHTASIALINANNQKLQNINQMSAGSKRYKKRKFTIRGGSQGQVAVPVSKPMYNPGVGANADPITQQAGLNQNSMQSAAWSVNDNYASKMGGSHKKGGNPNWSWPCYSGGKRRRTKNRKNRRSRRSRRTRHYR